MSNGLRESFEHRARRDNITVCGFDGKVIQNIRNPVAGFIWVYLSSLRSNEIYIHSNFLMHKFNLNSEELQDCMEYLINVGLIEVFKTLNENNSLTENGMHVKCGSLYFDKLNSNFEFDCDLTRGN